METGCVRLTSPGNPAPMRNANVASLVLIRPTYRPLSVRRLKKYFLKKFIANSPVLSRFFNRCSAYRREFVRRRLLRLVAFGVRLVQFGDALNLAGYAEPRARTNRARGKRRVARAGANRAVVTIFGEGTDSLKQSPNLPALPRFQVMPVQQLVAERQVVARRRIQHTAAEGANGVHGLAGLRLGVEGRYADARNDDLAQGQRGLKAVGEGLRVLQALKRSVVGSGRRFGLELDLLVLRLLVVILLVLFLLLAGSIVGPLHFLDVLGHAVDGVLDLVKRASMAASRVFFLSSSSSSSSDSASRVRPAEWTWTCVAVAPFSGNSSRTAVMAPSSFFLKASKILSFRLFISGSFTVCRSPIAQRGPQRPLSTRAT